jgi:hypothetical protein
MINPEKAPGPKYANTSAQTSAGTTVCHDVDDAQAHYDAQNVSCSH